MLQSLSCKTLLFSDMQILNKTLQTASERGKSTIWLIAILFTRKPRLVQCHVSAEPTTLYLFVRSVDKAKNSANIWRVLIRSITTNNNMDFFGQNTSLHFNNRKITSYKFAFSVYSFCSDIEIRDISSNYTDIRPNRFQGRLFNWF